MFTTSLHVNPMKCAGKMHIYPEDRGGGMQKEWIASGTLITRQGEVEGYVCVRDGIISEIGTDIRVDADAQGIVAPCFVNAHTHIGDSVIKDP
ncbi:MAG TPA: hypothetical protein HA257_09105, partial [Candidatus Methanoperedenaceae archaeon]|nr:hypothetical protein [Candidatus Methanoperedenaceae archaeon]